MAKTYKKLRGITERSERDGAWQIQYYVNGERKREQVATRQEAIHLLA